MICLTVIMYRLILKFYNQYMGLYILDFNSKFNNNFLPLFPIQG